MPARTLLALIVVVLLAAIGAGAAYQQSRIGSAKAEAETVRQQLRAMTDERDTALQERDLARTSVRTVTEYVDRVQTVYVNGKTITKEIPTYVTQSADAACTIPTGFVRIHDAAVANAAPKLGAGDPDAPAAGITLSAVADTVADNYATCHVIREQVIGLQAYINSLPETRQP